MVLAPSYVSGFILFDNIEAQVILIDVYIIHSKLKFASKQLYIRVKQWIFQILFVYYKNNLKIFTILYRNKITCDKKKKKKEFGELNLTG